MPADEETRAAEYRENARLRCLEREARCRALAGDPDAEAAVMAAWQPVLCLIAEHQPSEPSLLGLPPI